MSYQQYRPQSFQVLPLVVKNLLIINALLFLATWVFANQFNTDLTDYLGLHYFTSDLFKPYQLVTYMFMHGGLDHIFFNMFALWMFGNVLENFWGSKRFLVFYMATGIGAALIFLGFQAFGYSQLNTAIADLVSSPLPENYLSLMNSYFGQFMNVPEIQSQVQAFAGEWSHNLTDPQYIQTALTDINQLMTMRINTPMVGASGAVYGVLLAFGMLFPNTLLYVYFLIPIKAKYFVILYGALELFMAIQNNPGDNVAHFAHLGGMLFGFILIKYWQKRSNRFY
ncbi:MAG: rhomboid family intrarane serine protease [Bacteroidetes bacterium]|jgi:membrane associated rhomboid family serine protease|nr:rhomboid family intrarane serine protease [Bacteroidota bacterium]